MCRLGLRCSDGEGGRDRSRLCWYHCWVGGGLNASSNILNYESCGTVLMYKKPSLLQLFSGQVGPHCPPLVMCGCPPQYRGPSPPAAVTGKSCHYRRCSCSFISYLLFSSPSPPFCSVFPALQTRNPGSLLCGDYTGSGTHERD